LKNGIVEAIAGAESMGGGTIIVHITRKPFERCTFKSAVRIFKKYNIGGASSGNSALLYVNPRKRTFALLAGERLWRATGQAYWNGLAATLKDSLLSTFHENAISLAVLTIGITMEKHFPCPQK